MAVFPHTLLLTPVVQGRDKYLPVEVRRGEVIQVRAGAVHHSSLIGKQYGSKVC
jgi:tRNA A58 N-methylase Trm61